ncbi:dynamin family protein [Metasolibacillus meyeri]|uniref:dynamin family protein n=1 Tax=Metasolibacillus meyeri TaxID=1071052 RepID=UPI000D30BD01|nr:dynamin family protein [Metasolibacillus meyeri]
MHLFNKTAIEQENFQRHLAKLEQITEQLSFLSVEDLSMVRNLKESFQLKIDDFFQENRKLNIGIIGQVKAGKSSFLNTMIFDGKDVLPRASTPKTATLTKIEYAEENSIEIFYYSHEEWQQIQERAKSQSELDEYRVAREIVKLAQQQQIDVQSYLEKGSEVVTFASETELMSQLNEYVGENGRLTALVKHVTLKINNPHLQEISIVDTPGLNDPIASRTDKTKQFMEVCDVVFFLSRASNFLDQTDMDLLTSQLPQKGVKRLVLIASRYDEGLQDTIYDFDSLEEADEDTKKRLRRVANKNINAFIERLEQRNASDVLKVVIKECASPIFVSSMAHNMSSKDEHQFAKDEQIIFENLNEHDDLTLEMLHYIGNIRDVQQVFTEVIKQKEVTLLEKSKSFLPLAEQQLQLELNNLLTLQKRRLTMLVEHDQESISKQKQEIKTQILNIQSATKNIFTDLFTKLEASKTQGSMALRQASKDYSNVTERTGIETETRSRTVSTSKWYNPFSWGSSSTEYYTVETRYYYLDVSDALENLRNFGVDAVNMVEQAFLDAVSFHELKRKLLTTVIENFDTGSEFYEPAYFKLLTEKTIQAIEIPVFKMDISQYLSTLGSSFSGEVRDASSKVEMKNKLASYVGEILEEISNRFTDEVKAFKEKLLFIEDNFTSELLKNITDEYEIVLTQFENKETEIKKLRDGIQKIEHLIHLSNVESVI